MKILILTPRICPARYYYYLELGDLADLTVISELLPESSDFNNTIESSPKSFKLIYLNAIRVKDYLSFSLKIFKFLRIYNNHRIIIEQYSSPTSMLAIVYLRLNKKSFFLNADGGFVKYDESIFKRALKKSIISSATYYLSNGELAKVYLIYYGALPKRIFHFPLASSQRKVLSDVFNSREELLKFKFSLFESSKPIITYVGRFVSEKGFDIFYDLVVSNRINANFIMIGGNLDINRINGLSNTGIKVLDQVNKEDVYKYLAISDLHIIPSRRDIWNYTLIEAYNMQTRVTASNHTGSAIELLFNKEKLLFNTNNIDELVGKVNYALMLDKTNDELDYYDSISNVYTSQNMAKTIFAIMNSLESSIDYECK
jgi:glycosyltransferase involved in cell wall biosynthesis